MKKEKTILIAIVTILVILTITGISVSLLYSKMPKKTSNILKDIANNIENITSYHTTIVIKDSTKMLSVDGSALIKDNYHYFLANINKHNGETPAQLRYDFDLVEQRYKQNVIENSEILSTNIYGETENIRNINYLDSTRLLIYMSELLYDKKTKCTKNVCTYLMNEYDITTFSTLTSLITLYESNQLFENYSGDLNMKLTIDKDTLTITKVELLLNNNVSIVISFDSFNKINFNV